ncbi:hypothetical protein J6590_018289 [Homalodisca vitripennis]|nr:hypothetical protein J6590_018289 [Homalodisca vitripennis]
MAFPPSVAMKIEKTHPAPINRVNRYSSLLPGRHEWSSSEILSVSYNPMPMNQVRNLVTQQEGAASEIPIEERLCCIISEDDNPNFCNRACGDLLTSLMAWSKEHHREP